MMKILPPFQQEVSGLQLFFITLLFFGDENDATLAEIEVGLMQRMFA